MATTVDLQVRPIGVVHSSVADLHRMPMNGVPAQVEVYPEFEPALLDLESNSHLIVLGWFHLAERERLQVGGKTPTPEHPLRGVFGLRCSDRPNPIGLNIARLLRVEGRLVFLDRLDMVDGTQVVDLKRYSPGWDCVFSARTSRELRPLAGPREVLKADLLLEAEHFHGEACAAAERAAAMVLLVAERWRVSPKDPGFRVEVGRDDCLADCLQAVCAATLGSGRLRVCDATTCRFVFGDRQALFAESGELLSEASGDE
ncbi:MAG: tRNA (N6-threonylcarbamoyladenosine(37)-N6)-methyltransferase TrmO [Chloroflexi bacterium]|nr:tRNA (N6-threonylcarbamoyladenosine(37)-N6)-methyltransferase TrmO [Chloroflexota bacterium]